MNDAIDVAEEVREDAGDDVPSEDEEYARVGLTTPKDPDVEPPDHDLIIRLPIFDIDLTIRTPLFPLPLLPEVVCSSSKSLNPT